MSISVEYNHAGKCGPHMFPPTSPTPVETKTPYIMMSQLVFGCECVRHFRAAVMHVVGF